MSQTKVKIYLLAFSLMILIGCDLSDSLKNKEWYKLATQYVEIENKLYLTTGDSLTDYVYNLLDQRKKITTEYINTPPPSSEDIIALLNSDKVNQINVGLAVISLSDNPGTKLINYVLPLLNNTDKDTRRFAIDAIENMVKGHIDNFSDDISSYILSEQDADLVFVSMKLVMKLKPDIAFRILITLLERDNISTRQIVYAFLGRLGTKYQEEAIEHIVKIKSIDKSRFKTEYLKFDD
jgi:HEAT repeat protein